MSKRELMIFVTGIGMGMRTPYKGPVAWGQFGMALGLTDEDSEAMLEVLVECEEALFADGAVVQIETPQEPRQ